MEDVHLGELKADAPKVVDRALRGEVTRIINNKARLVVGPGARGLFPVRVKEEDELEPLEFLEAPTRD